MARPTAAALALVAALAPAAAGHRQPTGDQPSTDLPPAAEVAPARPVARPEKAGDAARPRPVAEDARLQAARLQTLLARAGFSPGLIDGKPGRKTAIALAELRRAKSIDSAAPALPPLDEATLAALNATTEFWTKWYRVADADAALITGPIPADWNERATLAVSGYESMQELLAERGWCSQETVAWLNPGLDLAQLKPGDKVILPDVPDAFTPGPRAAALPRPARVDVQLGEKLIRGLDDAGNTLFLLHCSIAASVEKRPAGELHVKVIATDPSYTFDPKDWPEVHNVTAKLTIAPGPRCPVGLAWIGLDLPGYGMHGTVRPQDIGKTGSHGCFRLANWDALRLARAVRTGTPVTVRE